MKHEWVTRPHWVKFIIGGNSDGKVWSCIHTWPAQRLIWDRTQITNADKRDRHSTAWLLYMCADDLCDNYVFYMIFIRHKIMFNCEMIFNHFLYYFCIFIYLSAFHIYNMDLDTDWKLFITLMSIWKNIYFAFQQHEFSLTSLMHYGPYQDCLLSGYFCWIPVLSYPHWFNPLRGCAINGAFLIKTRDQKLTIKSHSLMSWCDIP